MKKRILLVEDDLNFGAVLKSYLELNDFKVDWIDDGKNALKEFEKQSFDLVLLDVMLPHVDGFTIAREIRSTDTKTPFIFITAKTLRDDIVQGYKTGADDYITKPFDSEILLYKVKAILNRGKPGARHVEDDIFQLGIFEFDYRGRQLKAPETDIKQSLSPKESELLKLLIEHKGEVLPKSLALNRIWGDANYFTTRSMDVYVAKLRKYLSKDKNIKIITLHGAGYRMIYP
jgi:DNA-binding response OmpR family regulator